MDVRIITISREFGSGGRTIGKQAAAALEIPCYDSELVQRIAEQSGFDPAYIEDNGEDAPGGPIVSAFSHRRGRSADAPLLFRKLILSSFSSRRDRAACRTGSP